MSLFRAFDDIREQFWCEIFRIGDDDEYSDRYMNLTVESAKSAQTKTLSRDVCRISPSDSERATTNADNYMLQLPTELQVMILQHLTFGEVESLRRTCRPMRTRIDKPFIREIFPTIKFDLLSTCFRCLRYDPVRDHLIHADESDARYPLANECLDCVSSRGGFVVGRTYTLGTFATVCVCRYCGSPVTNDAAWKEYEFHRACYRRYRMILLYYFLVGCAQCVITVVAGALCWRYFKGNRQVIVPSIINFPMACWLFCLNVARGMELRTYHWSLLLELSILGLWIPPLTAILGMMQQRLEGPIKADIATIFFIVCNIIFRSINALGNILLVCEYKLWRRFRSNQSATRRAFNRVAAFLIFWTYPPSIEQNEPGRWWPAKGSAKAVGV